MGARESPPPSRPSPRPRPRPLLTSPPLPQGWGRPLPGPRGLPGFRARARDQPSAIKRENRVLLEVLAVKGVSERQG